MKKLSALLFITLASCTYRWAVAQEVVMGRGLVCDTAEQAEQVASASNKAVALNDVNKPEVVCSVIEVLYVRGEMKRQVDFRGDTIAITEILVVGVRENGVIYQISPTTQYTLFYLGKGV